MSRTFTSFLLAPLLFLAVRAASAEDIVYLAPEGQDHGRMAVQGEIIDYTGEAITIARPTGPPRRLPASRVLEIETDWHEAHEAGRQAMARHDYAAAARHLTDANRGEDRVWARRLILTDLMRCYAALGRPEQAGELFLAIVQSDPTTPAYAVAPLAWFPDDRVSRAKAENWLGQRDQPAAVLLGASYLLSTTASPAARQALVELVNHGDGPIATLAEAQLWRTDLLRAEAKDADRWAARIEQMDESLRAGPYFVLGQAYDRLGTNDAAALAYLRVPVLFGGQRELAARALVAAGRASQKSGFPDEAVRLWTEVIATYAGTPHRTEAEQLLKTAPRVDSIAP
jgi:tetratricopeptide (TPR) repeat protein